MNNADKPAFIQCEDSQMKKSAFDPDINYGLTKREYFAGLAMQGMLSNPTFFELLQEKVNAEDQAAFLCKAAIEQADELLEQLTHPQS